MGATGANELCWTTARELARLIRTRAVSPVEVTDAILGRIEQVNPRINAYCTITAEVARAAATDAEEILMRGDELGPLHGVPYSLKDLTPTRGIRTTNGSRIFEHHVPEADAILVERLREAGAVLLGKTNTPEFGCKPFTDNQIFGATRNPWNLARSSGGSSGGAAAAVASGLGPIAEGSDLAASIRQPASWCGVVGFKPGQGRVADYPNASGWAGMTHHGPIARTVGDAALMLGVMAGPDPRDPLALPNSGEDWAALTEHPEIEGLRVAWTPDLGGAAAIDPSVAAICASAAKAFGELGCVVDEASPEVGEIQETFLTLNAGLRQATLGQYLDQWREQMDPILVRRIEVSRDRTATDVGRAEVERTAYHRRLASFFGRYDLLLLPTAATAATPLDDPIPAEIGGRPISQHLDMLVPTFAFNLSNHPAISVPCGTAPDGLPVGLQIVAGWQQDALALRAAAAFELARPWADRRPPLD